MTHQGIQSPGHSLSSMALPWPGEIDREETRMLNLPRRMLLLGMLALGIVFFQATAAHAGKARLPNVIFILADDLGYGELGCFGQKKIKTPNLDKLAAEGMRFTQHYSG